MSSNAVPGYSERSARKARSTCSGPTDTPLSRACWSRRVRETRPSTMLARSTSAGPLPSPPTRSCCSSRSKAARETGSPLTTATGAGPVLSPPEVPERHPATRRAASPAAMAAAVRNLLLCRRRSGRGHGRAGLGARRRHRARGHRAGSGSGRRRDDDLLELGVVHRDLGLLAELLHVVVELLGALLALEPGLDLRLDLVDGAGDPLLAAGDADDPEALLRLDQHLLAFLAAEGGRREGLAELLGVLVLGAEPQVAAVALAGGVVRGGAGQRLEGLGILLGAGLELGEQLLRLGALLGPILLGGGDEQGGGAHPGRLHEVVLVLVVELLDVGVGDVLRIAVPEALLHELLHHGLLHGELDVGVVLVPLLLGGAGQDLELHEAVEELLLPIQALVALAEERGLLVEARLELGDGDDHAFALGDGGAALLRAGRGRLASRKGEDDRETSRDECTRHRGEAPVFVG